MRIEGKGSFATVAEAVAAAAERDIVLIAPGVYEETVEVTRDIEIRGDPDEPSAVAFDIPDEGPAFRLRDADAVISGLTFISKTPDGGADRRPAIDVVGGAPVLDHLVARADASDSFDFVRLYETAEGTVVRDSRSSGVIRANRGARALIEANVLQPEFPDGPLAGIEATRADTYLRIEGNELDYVATVMGAQAELTANPIHGAQPALVMTDSGGTDQSISGTCGVMAMGGSPALLTDNEVGVQVAPSAEAVLTEVALCGNGVDVEADETATVERSGSAECAA